AICIAADDGKIRSNDPGANSGYRLPAGREFSCIINTGGGFEVKDAAGKILCAYIPLPEDVRSPLGSTTAKTVEFAVPKKYIGKISSSSKITLLTGAQDDHGGAGVGEFRNVTVKPAEWTGGGRKGSSGSNVYDIFTIN
ncbi:MAG: glucodextranase DOMON-like domain-containing protein, partial [Syntrophothermus sp.]